MGASTVDRQRIALKKRPGLGGLQCGRMLKAR